MRKLYGTIRSLKNLPYRGRPGTEEGTREVFFPPLPYVAVYRVDEGSRRLKSCVSITAPKTGLEARRVETDSLLMKVVRIRADFHHIRERRDPVRHHMHHVIHVL